MRVHFDADSCLESGNMVDFDEPRLVAATYAEWAVALHDSSTVADTVDAVIRFALKALGCSYAGVALVTRGRRPEVTAVTDPVVEEIYQVQIAAGHGPLMTAMAEQSTVLIRDTLADHRWPQWAEKVAGLGVRSVLDVPLATRRDSRTVGVLGLYNDRADGFSADDEAVAHILARHASVALATARHEENMAQAVDARKLIGQAMGILMERFDMDADRAFAVLRRYSQDHNRKLRDVALELIETRRLPTYPEGGEPGAGSPPGSP
jgi:GAF domain-containing protein